jgi:hypothetical protein
MRIVRDGSQIMEIRRGQLRVWNTGGTSKEVESRPISQFAAVELVFDISPDGGWMCGADDNGHVYFCNLNRGTAVDLGSFDRPTAACFSPIGDRVLLIAGAKVREYDIGHSKWVREFSEEGATTIRYSADAQRIAIAFENGGYTCIYDALTGEETLRLDIRASEILFAGDGKSLLTDGAPDGGLYYWPGKD